MEKELLNVLWKYTFFFLDSTSLRSVCCVCKRFQRICDSVELWKKMVEKEHGATVHELLFFLESLVQCKNPWKSFLLSNERELVSEEEAEEDSKKVMVSDPFIGKVYFFSEGVYTLWKIEKKSEDIQVVVMKRNDVFGIQPRDLAFAVTEYAGFFDMKSSSAVEKGTVRTNKRKYTGKFVEGRIQGKGRLEFSKKSFFFSFSSLFLFDLNCFLGRCLRRKLFERALQRRRYL